MRLSSSPGSTVFPRVPKYIDSQRLFVHGRSRAVDGDRLKPVQDGTPAGPQLERRAGDEDEMKKNLNDRFLKTVKRPESGRDTYIDIEGPGLELRRTANEATSASIPS